MTDGLYTDQERVEGEVLLARYHGCLYHNGPNAAPCKADRRRIGVLEPWVMDIVNDRIREVEEQRDLLLQAMWDARAELGFDTNGDKQFHSTNYAMIAANHVREACEMRQDYDDLMDGVE